MNDTPADPDLSSLRPLGEALERAVHQLGPPAQITAVIRVWEDVVGDDFAEFCQPERLAEGQLFVKASDAGWATELRYNSAYIISKLAELLDSDVVKTINVTVGPKTES